MEVVTCDLKDQLVKAEEYMILEFFLVEKNAITSYLRRNTL